MVSYEFLCAKAMVEVSVDQTNEDDLQFVS